MKIKLEQCYWKFYDGAILLTTFFVPVCEQFIVANLLKFNDLQREWHEEFSRLIGNIFYCRWAGSENETYTF